MTDALLDVRHLSVEVTVTHRTLPLLKDVSLTVMRGEVVGIVGESGSGKSMTARAIMGLLPAGASRSGEIHLNGRDIAAARRGELRKARMHEMAMIFQDPRASVNPVRRCGAQIVEVLQVNRKMTSARARARALELLESVSITDPDRVMAAYPSELSGGMLQRVLIAMALAVEPALLIADEATTSLDVTVQADIVAILNDLRSTGEAGLIFITHDLELAGVLCDRIVVMYAGEVVEQQVASELFASPRHPYTAGLLAARPDISQRQQRLPTIAGRPPSSADLVRGCAFAARCPIAIDRCLSQSPPATAIQPHGFSRCHRADETQEPGSFMLVAP